MSVLLSMLGGLVLGCVVAGVPAAAQLRTLTRQRDDARKGRTDVECELAAAATELRAERQAGADKLLLIEQAAARLDDRVKAAVSDAVAAGSDRLLELAAERSARERAEDDTRRVHERQALGALVGPIGDGLGRLEAGITGLHRERVQAEASLLTHIEQLGITHDKLLAGTNALVGALRRPQVRGRWGEQQLRNVVEAAGMLSNVDFLEQASIEGPEGRLRPDMIVRLPGSRRVVVDSKVPLDAWLDAQQADNKQDTAEHLKRHARQLATHLQHLNSKAYWEQLPGSPELVFAFVPNDQVYLAAVDADAGLVRRTAADRVVVATPMTLIALLKLAAFGWRQEQLTHNSEEILRAARDVYGRFVTFAEHLAKHGSQLESSYRSWNKVVASYDSRLIPAATRFAQLGAIEPRDNDRTPAPILTPPRLMRDGGAGPGDDATSGDDGSQSKAA